ncbi:HNH endonuclease signature motif containing protein [Isosphaeraceae bacterium EP7]
MLPRVLRTLVRDRAGDRCEFCPLPQDALPLATFHVEQIVARQHAGGDEAGNLALACHHCNGHKGPNLAGIDPDTGRIERLFHPREHRHAFALRGCTSTTTIRPSIRRPCQRR